jgi:hypothetical protein
MVLNNSCLLMRDWLASDVFHSLFCITGYLCAYLGFVVAHGRREAHDEVTVFGDCDT